MYHWAVLALELRSYILLTELNQAHLPTYKVYSGFTQYTQVMGLHPSEEMGPVTETSA